MIKQNISFRQHHDPQHPPQKTQHKTKASAGSSPARTLVGGKILTWMPAGDRRLSLLCLVAVVSRWRPRSFQFIHRHRRHRRRRRRRFLLAVDIITRGAIDGQRGDRQSMDGVGGDGVGERRDGRRRRRWHDHMGQQHRRWRLAVAAATWRYDDDPEEPASSLVDGDDRSRPNKMGDALSGAGGRRRPTTRRQQRRSRIV